MTTTQRHEIEAWLGPALTDMDPAQVDALEYLVLRWEADHPDADESETAAGMLAMYERITLGVTVERVEEAGQRLSDARAQAAEALDAALAIAEQAIESGLLSEAAAARSVGVTRVTLRRWLGKQD